jgi:hypothetical protein
MTRTVHPWPREHYGARVDGLAMRARFERHLEVLSKRTPD